MLLEALAPGEVLDTSPALCPGSVKVLPRDTVSLSFSCHLIILCVFKPLRELVNNFVSGTL